MWLGIKLFKLCDCIFTLFFYSFFFYFLLISSKGSYKKTWEKMKLNPVA